jgi:type I restriction enzyme S subunit
MNLADKSMCIDTSIGWIPDSWTANKLSGLVDVVYGKSPADIEKLEDGVPIFGTGGISGYTNTPLYDGPSIILGRKGTIDKVQLSDGPFWAIDTTFYTTPKKVFDWSWLYYCISSFDLRKLNEASGVPSLGRGSLEALHISTPPLPEQQKISTILTSVDDKLDVIARQISATQTLKQGLMQTLFSRGVGTQDTTGRWVVHSEFKVSELGEIPEGWTVQPLETLAESITVGIATSTTEHYVEDGVSFIRNQNIKEDFLDMSELLKISSEFDEKNKRKRVLEGDILTVRTGYPGVSCVVPEGLGYLQTFTTLITRPNRKLIDPNFASRYFNSPQGKGLMLHQAAGGAQQNINAGNLKKLLVPVPPLVEQGKIAQILGAIDAKRRSLEIKNEYHQTLKRGLMQKLLTGEWRVKLNSSAAAGDM